MSCPDPDCKGSYSIGHLPYKPIPPPPNLTESVKEPNNPRNPSKAQQPLILRTHCRSCRIANEDCSGLVFGPRCQRCTNLDLECDCKILRKACEECMKDRGKADWKECAGFREDCDACMEKVIACKEYVRGPGKGAIGEKPSQDAVADGKMDVIDGMKAIRAFAACERCLEEKLKCDEKLPGCGGCRVKGVECEYRLLMATISGSSKRRFEQRRSSLSHQEKLGEDTINEVGPPQSKLRLACNGCRKSRTMCSGIHPCNRCEELGLDCAFISKPAELEQILVEPMKTA